MPSALEIAKRKLTLTTHRIHTMPIVILMPHSRCNCRCVMCDIWLANKNGTELSAADLEKHLDFFRKYEVKWVVLSGGEALMHHNLWELCRQLRALNIKITLLSTGLLLRRFAPEVVMWCDEVIVSLDGSRDVHDAIRRVPRAYDRLAEGVAALRTEKPSVRITARSVVQRENYADFANIIAAARELALDEISFLPVDVSSSAFNHDQPPGVISEDSAALTLKQVYEFETLLEQTIADHPADFDSGFIAESPQKLRHMVRYFAALNGDGAFPPVQCNAPWVSTVIESDGTVRPCFFQETLGNIHETPLEKILNAPEAIQFRRQLDLATDPICHRCVCTLSLGSRASLPLAEA